MERFWGSFNHLHITKYSVTICSIIKEYSVWYEIEGSFFILFRSHITYKFPKTFSHYLSSSMWTFQNHGNLHTRTHARTHTHTYKQSFFQWNIYSFFGKELINSQLILQTNEEINSSNKWPRYLVTVEQCCPNFSCYSLLLHRTWNFRPFLSQLPFHCWC